jgi:hypothetical protein
MAIMLPLHVFNLGGGEGLKPFHIPAVIACILSFFVLKKKDKLYRYVIWFLIFALISSILSYATSAYSMWINMFIVLTGCLGLAYVDPKPFLMLTAIFIPIDIIVLFYHSIVEPQYRYQGFYNDPNYLCTTLIVFIFILLLVYTNIQKKLYKAVIIFTLVITYALILMTLSRTGLFGSLLLLLGASTTAIRKHFVKFIVAASICMVALLNYASNFIDNKWEQIYERIYENNDNIENAGSHRWDLSLQNIRFIMDNPQFIPFGLGGGTTYGKYAMQVPGLNKYRKDWHIDHNTWTSVFSEQGLFCFILFFIIINVTFNRMRKKTKNAKKYLLYGAFFSIFLFSFSISQKTYLPFWWIMFVLNNIKLRTLINDSRYNV